MAWRARGAAARGARSGAAARLAKAGWGRDAVPRPHSGPHPEEWPRGPSSSGAGGLASLFQDRAGQRFPPPALMPIL